MVKVNVKVESKVMDKVMVESSFSIGSPSKLEGVPERAEACVIPIHRSRITGHGDKSGSEKKRKNQIFVKKIDLLES